VTHAALAPDPRVEDGVRCSDQSRSLRLTQAARDGAMEAWLEILSQRHPTVIWVPKRALDLGAERT
jgi:hypothetical protein